MCRRYWISVLLVAGLASVAHAQIKNSQTAQTPTAAQRVAKPVADTPPTIPVTIQKDITRVARALEAANNNPRSAAEKILAERDVRAQEYMALAAILSVGIGVFTLILLGKTLNATKSAAQYAQRAADAAEAAVNEARVTTEVAKISAEQSGDQARRQLRAYLSAEPLGLASLDDGVRIIGHVAIRNVGNVPASNVSVYARMKFSDKSEAVFDIEPDIDSISRVIQPGASMRQGTRENCNYSKITDAPHGTSIFVYGVAYYQDGFGHRRFTRFCHRYDAASYDRLWRRPDNADRTIMRIEKARYHTEGNEAD